MTTLAPEALRWAGSEIDFRMPEYPSAVVSGIAPDRAHLDSGGFHVSIEDLIRFGNSDDYSWRHARNRLSSNDRRISAALDISMSTADMKKNWDRWYAVWSNRANDPRAMYFFEYIGWNGVGSAERLSFANGTRTVASSDHKWHSHRSVWRDVAGSMMMARAMVSVDRGESIAQWNASIGAGSATSTSEDEIDMGMGTDKAYNADRYIWQGFMDLADEIDKIRGDDGVPNVKVKNKFAVTFKAMAAGIATLVDRVGKLEARQVPTAAEIAAEVLRQMDARNTSKAPPTE